MQHNTNSQSVIPEVLANRINERIANYNLGLDILSSIMVVVAFIQIRYVRRADETARISAEAAIKTGEAAIKSNQINRDAMIADQRPWVSVKIDIGGPLTWNGQGANFVFNFTVENTGRTPALNAFVRLMIYPDLTSEVERQNEFSSLVREKSPARGISLFPNKPSVFKIGGSIYSAQLEEWRRWFAKTYKVDDYWVQPLLIGCVTYYSAFDNVQHQTGFIRYILRSVPVDGSVSIGPALGDISEHHLKLMMPVMNDGITD